jgi:hypothetical protein
MHDLLLILSLFRFLLIFIFFLLYIFYILISTFPILLFIYILKINPSDNYFIKIDIFIFNKNQIANQGYKIYYII